MASLLMEQSDLCTFCTSKQLFKKLILLYRKKKTFYLLRTLMYPKFVFPTVLKNPEDSQRNLNCIKYYTHTKINITIHTLQFFLKLTFFGFRLLRIFPNEILGRARSIDQAISAVFLPTALIIIWWRKLHIYPKYSYTLCIVSLNWKLQQSIT